jgi:hypothetical protein
MTLKEIESRELTKKELQQALLKLIYLHNGLAKEIEHLIATKQIRSVQEANLNTPFNL